jgi:hypothetical protein
MGIGGSVALIALGAILTFALDVRVGWLDLDVVGWILMVAGALGLILTMTVWNRRTRPVSTVSADPMVDDPADYRQPTEVRREEIRRTP